jgi:hypothetical protein
MELLYAPFVFRVNGLSTEAELNANGTIWSQFIHGNAAVLWDEQ